MPQSTRTATSLACLSTWSSAPSIFSARLPAINRLLMLLQSRKPNAQTRELTKLITLSHTVNISSGIINNEVVSWLETLV